MKKKLLSIMLLSIITISLTGCGKSSNENSIDESITSNYQDVEIVYFNPETSKKCTKEEFNQNLQSDDENHYKGYATGMKTGCLKWNLYAKNSNNTSYLLLDHNTTVNFVWNSNNDNTNNDEIIERLKQDTKTWNSKLNARLITADEIAKIVNNQKFNSKTTSEKNYFFFNTLTTDHKTISEKDTGTGFTWLYNNTSYCNGCINSVHTYSFDENGKTKEDSYSIEIGGYWTDTPVYDTTNKVWRVGYAGSLVAWEVKDANSFGIRPVIMVSNNDLK